MSETKPIYSPNISYMLKMMDVLKQFAEQGKVLEDKLGSIAKLSKQGLTDKLKEFEGNVEVRQQLEKYIKMREEFEKIEILLLKEAAEVLGFGPRDYLIKPLKDLIDQIKTGTVDSNVAVEHIKKLFKTVAINKAIDYSRMVPYVGEVFIGVLTSLDNYVATQVVMDRFVDLLTTVGVPSSNLNFIKSYSNENYFTKKYNLFREWLANGAEFQQSPLASIKEFGSGFYKEVSNIFSPPQTPQYTETTPNGEKTTTTGGGGGGGGVNEENWISVADARTNHRNKKTRNAVYKINQSIGSYLSRLRRTRRKPLHKSVTSFNVKRGL